MLPPFVAVAFCHGSASVHDLGPTAVSTRFPAAGPAETARSLHCRQQISHRSAPMTQDSTLVPNQSLPANVAQLATAAQLGPFRRVYLPKRRNWFLLFFTFLIALLTTVILIGFWLLWMIFRTPNLSRSQAARRLYLFERGFIVVDRPDAPQVFRWDGIDTVFQKIVSQRTYGIETAKNYLYTITTRDGRTVKLTQFWDGIGELGPYVNHAVSSALLPGLLDPLQRKQSEAFRDMTINPAGVARRRST